jgi:precorrin-3B methylase
MRFLKEIPLSDEERRWAVQREERQREDDVMSAIYDLMSDRCKRNITEIAEAIPQFRLNKVYDGVARLLDRRFFELTIDRRYRLIKTADVVQR